MVRRHGDGNLHRDPETAAHEFRLLRVLRQRGVPVPEPLHLDITGTVLPTPFVVLRFEEGSTAIAADVVEASLDSRVDHLVALHQIDAADPDVSFVLEQAPLVSWWLANPPEQLDDALQEGAIRDALARAWPWPSSGRQVLLHGDYWPGNVLWRDGRLTAILDWEDAARGDPLTDLAITRLELVWAFGSGLADRFTRRFLSQVRIDASTLPFWDLWAALRPAHHLADWAGDPAREASMRAAHAAFTASALGRVDA